MPDNASPVIFGSVGLGGFAWSAFHVLTHLSQQADPPIVLRAVCEPDLETHAQHVAEAEALGIKLFRDFDELLAEPIEALWVPLPIHLHRPFTERALAAGKAVLCEKPAAGCIDDVNAMIAARDKAALPVSIGYQSIHEPQVLQFKRMLLDGVIGDVTEARVWATWPRGDTYWNRSNWAGAIKRQGTWVLDSPANNALSHQVNLALFWLGDDLFTSAKLKSVEAELYRANPIENYDTASIRLTTESGATLLILLTHACNTTQGPNHLLLGTRGRATADDSFIVVNNTTRIQRPSNARLNAPQRLAKALRGIDDPDMVMCSLEIARAQTIAINGSSEASAIYNLPPSQLQRIKTNDTTITTITGIDAVFKKCFDEGKMLHESGQVDWAQPPGHKNLRDYNHFTAPAPAPGSDPASNPAPGTTTQQHAPT